MQRDHALVRPELPRGTVTLLFTDIEGSTRLLHELGDDYADVLGKHRAAVRDAFSRHGGVEVDTQGDAFFVAFARATDAVAAAGDIQLALSDGPVRVRIGVHTGEPVATDEGYVGTDVHRAARIMGAGHGGQVVLSEATRQLLDSNADLRELGDHRLKDLTAPQHLYQLGDADFPPLRTLYRTNLPIQATPLVGRERELEEAGALLRTHRLLTLTGPGGSGKTRLALQLAAEAIEDFPEGVFWAPLQALRDPALVERAVATSVGADDGLVEHIGAKRVLILLDNFEQVIDATPTISSLLAGTPNAKVLVTSREPLHTESEQRYPVDPLPDDDAATLFVERARSVAPGFQSVAEVGEICRLLDGLPLAIELAAARVALLDPDELLERLDRRLPLLASRSRDAPARQQTLRATIEWSYELLDAGEQELFRNLAVFRGSFTLVAAEAVCDADLGALESLVVKSLVRRWGTGRLGMLDTIREYAVEQLDAAPDAEELYRRHADYFLLVADEANLNAGRFGPVGSGSTSHCPSWTTSAPRWRGRCGADPSRSGSRSRRRWSSSGPSTTRTRGSAGSSGSSIAPRPRPRRRTCAPTPSSLSGARSASRASSQRPRSCGLGASRSSSNSRTRKAGRSFCTVSESLRCGATISRRARELVEASDKLHRRTGDTWGLAQTTGTSARLRGTRATSAALASSCGRARSWRRRRGHLGGSRERWQSSRGCL